MTTQTAHGGDEGEDGDGEMMMKMSNLLMRPKENKTFLIVFFHNFFCKVSASGDTTLTPVLTNVITMERITKDTEFILRGARKPLELLYISIQTATACCHLQIFLH